MKSLRLKHIFLLAAFAPFCCTPTAQAEPSPANDTPIIFQPPSPELPALDGGAALTDAQKRLRTGLLIGGTTAGLLWYGSAHWWKDSMGSSFRTVNEGWFGQDTYTGGADKFGHMYSTYTGTRLLTRAFEWAGHDRDSAAWLGAATAWGAMAAVEIGDGLSSHFRFSKEDLIMNTLGTGLGLLLEKKPELDEVLDFRLMYWPSGDARRLHQVDIEGDHSGQTYLFVAKASGIPTLRKIEPLRYLELAVGYGSRGYEPNVGGERSRHVYYGISLNIAEILGASVFRESGGSRAQKISNGILEFVQIPGTVALADHRL